MSRWIGNDHVDRVLGASDAWRERCFTADGSLFGEESLWTLEYIRDLKQRFLGNPIDGTDRTFFDKLREQLKGAPGEVVRLAAEIVWLLVLFPNSKSTRPDTKREQIRKVWGWAGNDLPDIPFLADEPLMGVGSPGTYYLARRDLQFGFMLEVMEAWKSLPPAERGRLMAEDAPWSFMAWLDAFEHAVRLPARNALLYFLFPDWFERILSNDHRRQIVESLKHRLSEERRPRGRSPPLGDLDRAISELRSGLEEDLGTGELDFYRPPIYGMWFSRVRDEARSQIGAALKSVLSEYDLELRQCGSKKKTLDTCASVNETTGFWDSPTAATNKPLRWFLHLALEDDRVVARIPAAHGSRRIAFANTAQGTSGAVTTRIVPAIRLGEDRFVFYETWEWLLLHCFLPALEVGSSGQLFDEFDEATGKLTYKGREQDYIAAGLIALQEDDNEFVAEELPRAIKYAEATEAIATLIHVAPSYGTPVVPRSVGHGDAL